MFTTLKFLTKAEAEAKAESMIADGLDADVRVAKDGTFEVVDMSSPFYNPGLRTYSTCENPCRVVFETADAMKGQPRKAIIAACVAKGVHPATAAKQYNDWNNEQKKGSGTSARPGCHSP